MKKPEIVNEKGRPETAFIPRSEENVTVERLNHLIEANNGVINVYETAADRLENKEYASMMHEFVEQHREFVRELANLVNSYSGDPEDDSPASSYVKKAWVTLKAAVTEGDGPVLNSAAEDAETILEEYGESMATDMPEDVRSIFREHMTKARLAHEKLSGLASALND